MDLSPRDKGLSHNPGLRTPLLKQNSLEYEGSHFLALLQLHELSFWLNSDSLASLKSYIDFKWLKREKELLQAYHSNHNP